MHKQPRPCRLSWICSHHNPQYAGDRQPPRPQQRPRHTQTQTQSPKRQNGPPRRGSLGPPRSADRRAAIALAAHSTAPGPTQAGRRRHLWHRRLLLTQNVGRDRDREHENRSPERSAKPRRKPSGGTSGAEDPDSTLTHYLRVKVHHHHHHHNPHYHHPTHHHHTPLSLPGHA